MKDSDNRYYKPEIEEFHVGFEYEAKQFLKTITHPHDMDNTESRWIKCIWSKFIDFKEVFNVEYEDSSIIDVSVPDCIRVKRLDVDDILSLGFVQKDLDTFKLGKFYFELDNEYKNHIYQKEHAFKDRILFAGKIKNKSELKRLLKQLGVL